MPDKTNIENTLIQEAIEAHRQSAKRPSASTLTVRQAYAANGYNFQSAVAAACCTFGGLHAPIAQAMHLLHDEQLDEEGILAAVKEGVIIPGLGNSFIKGEPDDLWREVEQRLPLSEKHRPFYERLQLCRSALLGLGKNLHPNAAGLTAVVALGFNMSANQAVGLALQSRIPVWARMCDADVASLAPREQERPA